ncbi:MAG: hypothetical protein P0107_03185 [Nitrosomonas sp.]|nr:hypothetical protein [Nitrosomonas sp.]
MPDSNSVWLDTAIPQDFPKLFHPFAEETSIPSGASALEQIRTPNQSGRIQKMTIQPENFRKLTEWAQFLSEVEIPVLRKTANDLAALREQEPNPSARNVARIIRHDPLMTVKLLRHLQQHKQAAAAGNRAGRTGTDHAGCGKRTRSGCR